MIGLRPIRHQDRTAHRSCRAKDARPATRLGPDRQNRVSPGQNGRKASAYRVRRFLPRAAAPRHKGQSALALSTGAISESRSAPAGAPAPRTRPRDRGRSRESGTSSQHSSRGITIAAKRVGRCQNLWLVNITLLPRDLIGRSRKQCPLTNGTPVAPRGSCPLAVRIAAVPCPWLCTVPWGSSRPGCGLPGRATPDRTGPGIGAHMRSFRAHQREATQKITERIDLEQHANNPPVPRYVPTFRRASASRVRRGRTGSLRPMPRSYQRTPSQPGRKDGQDAPAQPR